MRGGNITGVFVSEISSESPCAKKLQIGDQILEVNGRNMQNAIAEQVATELNRPSETLAILARYNYQSKMAVDCNYSPQNTHVDAAINAHLVPALARSLGDTFSLFLVGFSLISPAGGDHFYARAQFNHKSDNDSELSVTNGDLLLVENSLVDGQIGKWYVHKVDERDNRVKHGIVPSRIR